MQTVTKSSLKVDHQVLEHMAGKSDSDVLSDTDSYQTADDDDLLMSVGLDDADDDTPRSTAHVSGLKYCDQNAERQQDSSEEFGSSSSSEEDDVHTDQKVGEDHWRHAFRRCESEKRRNSYQFAISTSRVLTPNTDEDNVVCDLDPREFHHEHVEMSDRSDEESDSHSEDVLWDIDPREFSHPSIQPTQLTMPQNSDFIVKHVTSTEEDGREVSDEENQSDSEVSEADPLEGPPESLSPLSKGHTDVTERHESIIEGDVLPTIVILSPTEKVLDTDHREWIVRQSAARATFDLSVLLEQLPSLTAAENKERLPIVRAVVSETTELIRAELIDTVASWVKPYIYDDLNLSSSPEKESHYPFEENFPAPDYDSSTSSEADTDVAVDSDISIDVCNDRSPTPDYNTLSPIVEKDQEFPFDFSERSKPDISDVHKSADCRSDATKVSDDFDDRSASQPLSFERKGSQRYSKAVHPNAVPLEPELSEMGDAAFEQKDADVSDAFDQAHFTELMQKDPCKAEEQYRSGTDSANDEGLSKALIPSADQSSRFSNLGRSSYVRRRTGKRSVVILHCTFLFQVQRRHCTIP